MKWWLQKNLGPGAWKEVVKASDTICSVSTSFATYPYSILGYAARSQCLGGIYQVIGAAFQKPGARKIPRTPSNDGDVRCSSIYGECYEEAESLARAAGPHAVSLTCLIDISVDYGSAPVIRITQSVRSGLKQV